MHGYHTIVRVPRTIPRFALGLALGAGCAAMCVGCGAETPAAAPAVKSLPKASAQTAQPSAAQSDPVQPATDPRATQQGPPARRPFASAPLADLAAEGKNRAFDLPEIDDDKMAVAGIRKLAGKHITIYTDLPVGEVDELPAVFDAAVPLWCEYFGVDLAKIAQWKTYGHMMRDKERFVGTGLYLESLPEFPHGYSQGSQLWLYDQPSGYYRRHLLLHEGTHCFMFRWLGGAGPPWYMEGIAELLATHRWHAGKLALAVMPRTRDEVPYWGRVKIIRDDWAAGRGLSLTDVMHYDAQAHLRNEPYGWCWGAAAFLDQHPLTQAAFRQLKEGAADRTIDFSKRFQERLKPHWNQIAEDWQLFVTQCDYGYDVARAAVVHRPVAPLPAGGAKVTLDTARGWQSSGYRLEGGKTYEISATGRYEVAGGANPWPCEAGGITLRYHEGQPLGMLLAATKGGSRASAVSPLINAYPVGLSSELTPDSSGPLYLRINEGANGLGDNRGTLEVEIRRK
ncbi:MAG: hypothetical protein WD872_14970 [Pirellulaceae bacterium]